MAISASSAMFLACLKSNNFDSSALGFAWAVFMLMMLLTFIWQEMRMKR